MDVGEIILDAIRYPSSDWKKIIILGVILIIPIVDFIGLGYGVTEEPEKPVD